MNTTDADPKPSCVISSHDNSQHAVESADISPVAAHRPLSTSNLVSPVHSHSTMDLSRSSIITSPVDPPSMTSCERDNGLRRIRQAPWTRKVSDPSPGLPRSASCFTLYHPASQNPSRRQSLASSTTESPSLVFSEDLTRFPQESLHSFSFAQQTNSTMHNRENLLKRSIDFMKDKQGHEVNGSSITNSTVQTSCDVEVQNMLDLMKRADMIPKRTGDAARQASLSRLDTILPQRAQFTIADSPTEYASINAQLSPDYPVPSSQQDNPDIPIPLMPVVSSDARIQPFTPILERQESSPTRKSHMRRTFTEIAGYDLQERLTSALGKPYLAAKDIGLHADALISPRYPSKEKPRRSMTINSAGAPHSHGTRQTGAAQAIFTTEASAPWTITAANDLACLIFGVSKAEVRKMGIMEVVRAERRKWLESKLRPLHIDPTIRRSNSRKEGSRLSATPSPTAVKTNVLGSGGGLGGVTARLLNKPPSRQTYQSRRSRGSDGDSTIVPPTATPKLQRANSLSSKNRSRGVLLCGDVIPIQKRNGASGSATLWVKEKQGGMIWVLEEVAEDVAQLKLDEVGCITNGEGNTEAIFGLERLRRGMDVKKLIPGLPKQLGTYSGALDWDEIQMVRRYTAKTAAGANIPVTVDLMENSSTVRISSFPNIAGIIVLSSQTLDITSSNSVFSAALFGYENPNGLHITTLIPQFDKLLRLISDEDSIDLQDGIVIPEHSFRRARVLMAVRENLKDASSNFVQPMGLQALHRDGAEITVDVQMRIVKSEPKPVVQEDTIVEEDYQDEHDILEAMPTVSYALWITYSKQIHAVINNSTTDTHLIMSRPGTPPPQPSPSLPSPTHSSSKHSASAQASPNISRASSGNILTISSQSTESGANASDLSDRLDEATTTTNAVATSPLVRALETEPFEHPSPAALAAGARVTKKKAIADFIILEEMGKGAYGEVKLVRYKKACAQKMVIKYVTKRRILVDTWTRDRKLGTVPLEIHVLDYLRKDGHQHPNIVEMADFFEDDVNYYIEMLPHGLPGVDLFDYIELRVNMEERECRSIFVQVASALHHLHNNARVVHRDIKDENVILDGEGRVKLADFGSAAYIKSGPFDVFVGTIDYAAPEVLRGNPYRGKEQDVWALGILLYTIVYKENPFYSIDEIMDHDLRVPYVMSEECLDLIRKMLDRDVERRIGIGDVLKHEWCIIGEEALDDL